MPLVDIKTKERWYPTGGDDSAEPNFVRELRAATPGILVLAWADTGWGEANPDSVLPDIVPPYHFDTECDSEPSDVAITVRPNWTADRFATMVEFRRNFIKRLFEWMKPRYGNLVVLFDIDIDFVMGCGASLHSIGDVGPHWPDADTPSYRLT